MHHPWDDPRRIQQFADRRRLEDFPRDYSDQGDYLMPGSLNRGDALNPSDFLREDDYHWARVDQLRHEQMLHERMVLDGPPLGVSTNQTFVTQPLQISNAPRPAEPDPHAYPELQESLRSLMERCQTWPDTMRRQREYFLRDAEALGFPQTDWVRAERVSWKFRCTELVEAFERVYDTLVPPELSDQVRRIQMGLHGVWRLHLAFGAKQSMSLPADLHTQLVQLVQQSRFGSRKQIREWLVTAEQQARHICVTVLQHERQRGSVFDPSDTSHALWRAWQLGFITEEDLA